MHQGQESNYRRSSDIRRVQNNKSPGLYVVYALFAGSKCCPSKLYVLLVCCLLWASQSPKQRVLIVVQAARGYRNLPYYTTLVMAAPPHLALLYSAKSGQFGATLYTALLICLGGRRCCPDRFNKRSGALCSGMMRLCHDRKLPSLKYNYCAEIVKFISSASSSA